MICLTNQFSKIMGVKPNLQDMTPFQTNLCIFSKLREADAPVERYQILRLPRVIGHETDNIIIAYKRLLPVHMSCFLEES